MKIKATKMKTDWCGDREFDVTVDGESVAHATSYDGFEFFVSTLHYGGRVWTLDADFSEDARVAKRQAVAEVRRLLTLEQERKEALEASIARNRVDIAALEASIARVDAVLGKSS